MYHVLVVKNPNGVWEPEFGSYVKEEVQFEKADYKAQGYKKSQLKL